MSFTLYLMPTEGEHFDVAVIREAFGEFLSEHPTGIGYRIRYDPENESTVDMEVTEDGKVDSLSVDRPCGDDRLFVALHRILASIPSFMTYPDEELPCLVATPEAADAVREHHPEMVSGLKICATPQALVADW